MTMKIEHGDCLEIMAGMDAESIDAIVTDPPCHLTAKKKGRLNQSCISTGFMGKKWDGGDVAFRPETWRLCLDVLKPGGHMLVFGGSRTFGRMQVAIEDAGFEIRDTILWLYGSGFPKSHDVSKGIDKAAAIKRTRNPKFDVVRSWLKKLVAARGLTYLEIDTALGNPNSHKASHYLSNSQPQIPTPKDWEILKRLLIVDNDLVRPPKDNILILFEREVTGLRKVQRGVAFTSDGPNELPITVPATDAAREWQGWGTALKPAAEMICLARKPLDEKTIAANVLEHGTGALNIDGCRVPAEPGANFKRPVNHTGVHEGWDRPWKHNPDALARERIKRNGIERKAETLGRWPANVIHDGSPEVMEAFAVSGESKSVGGGGSGATAFGQGSGWNAHNNRTIPIVRAGDSGTAARFFYHAKANKKDRLGSKHPTVKPVDLIAYLCRLITPPGGIVLDPFAGSGTIATACIREGFDCVMIEREAEYVADIKARCSDYSMERKIES